MVEINIPRDQQEALAAIDRAELAKLVDRSVQTEQSGDLRRYLFTCGPYISTRLSDFERALSQHRESKAPQKRERTAYALHSAASELRYAVEGMIDRMEEEQKDAELFFVDDQIWPSHRLNNPLSVTVRYRWRRTVADEWTYGTIDFTYAVDLRPDYATPPPKRKLSAAKQEQEIQKRLYQEWEHLMRNALYSVRDFFKHGGSGADIPKRFAARLDRYSRGLNNFSTRFWL